MTGKLAGKILLNVMLLVEAGYELKKIVDTVRAMQSAGSTDNDVSKYLADLADQVLRDLRAAP
jgi:hypothetical protein